MKKVVSLPVAKRARIKAFNERMGAARDYNALYAEIEDLQSEVTYLKALIECKPSAVNELNSRNKALMAENEMLLDTLDDLTSDDSYQSNRDFSHEENLERALRENQDLWEIEQNILKEKITYLEGLLSRERQSLVDAQDEITKLMNELLRATSK